MFMVIISVSREGTLCTGGYKHANCSISWSLHTKCAVFSKMDKSFSCEWVIKKLTWLVCWNTIGAHQQACVCVDLLLCWLLFFPILEDFVQKSIYICCLYYLVMLEIWIHKLLIFRDSCNSIWKLCYWNGRTFFKSLEMVSPDLNS